MTVMKPSAAMTIWGIIALFVGPFIWASSAMSAASASIFEDTSSYAGGQVVGFLVSVLGLILTLVGAYRALAKIDAIPVPVPVPPQMQAPVHSFQPPVQSFQPPVQSFQPPGQPVAPSFPPPNRTFQPPMPPHSPGRGSENERM
jgi:hypothetical protein